MIKLIYKAAKPYIYPNLVKKCVLESSVMADYILSQSLKITQPVKAGWYMLELEAKGVFETASLDVFFEHTHNLPLPIRANKMMKRIVYLPEQSNYINLTLHIHGKSGSLNLLRLVPIKEAFAKARMLKRLSNHPLLTKERVFAKINKKATTRKIEVNQVMFETYNKVFCEASHDSYQQWIDDVEPELIEQFNLDNSGDTVLDDYVCLVDSNYILHEGSKELLIHYLAKHPNASLVYPDEDQFNQEGMRSNPWFKTDWNYDLFLAQDYVANCFVCRKAWYAEHKLLFDMLGLEHALASILPKLPEDSVVHLPLVLVHKRSSASNNLDQKRELERGVAIKTALPNLASVDFINNSLAFSFSIPNPEPLVSLIIPTRNGFEILKPCVESILDKTTYTNFEILILDNQSTDDATLVWFKSIQEDTRIRVLPYDHPFNYSAINNFGVKHAQGSIIGLINNDVEVIGGNWLTEMVSHACRAEVGCVGAKLYYSNGQIQHAGVILGLGHVAGHAHRFAERDSSGYFNRLNLVQNYSAVTGACLLVRRSIYEQVGGLNERDLAVAYNDVDFCLRVRAAGYRNVWTPHAELYHHESVSRGEDDTPEKKARFAKEVAYMRSTWAEELKNDPCYNPNLSKLREDFSLREF